MGTPASSTIRQPGAPLLGYRLTDTYGLVLALIVIDYIAVSTVIDSTWGSVFTIFLLGVTLWFTLRVSRSRRVWQVLAATFLLTSTVIALISAVLPGAAGYSRYVATLGGLVLLITPFAIVRRVASQRVITTEVILAALCVYLLIGFCFAFIYSAAALFSPSPFFTGQPQTTFNETLFFSYSTLTTVGYGNLVPAESLGQTFAMLEALFGQIYLVLIVARLVSLWGQERPAVPPADRRKYLDASKESGGSVGDSG